MRSHVKKKPRDPNAISGVCGTGPARRGDALFIRGDEAVGVHRKDAVDVASGSETFVTSTTLHSNGSETQTNASSFDRLETRFCDARDCGTVSASASRKKEKRVSPARRVFGLTCGRQRAAKEVARVASELVERRDETLRAWFTRVGRNKRVLAGTRRPNSRKVQRANLRSG